MIQALARTFRATHGRFFQRLYSSYLSYARGEISRACESDSCKRVSSVPTTLIFSISTTSMAPLLYVLSHFRRKNHCGITRVQRRRTGCGLLTACAPKEGPILKTEHGAHTGSTSEFSEDDDEVIWWIWAWTGMRISWESRNVVSLLICCLTGKASNVTLYLYILLV